MIPESERVAGSSQELLADNALFELGLSCPTYVGSPIPLVSDEQGAHFEGGPETYALGGGG